MNQNTLRSILALLLAVLLAVCLLTGCAGSGGSNGAGETPEDLTGAETGTTEEPESGEDLTEPTTLDTTPATEAGTEPEAPSEATEAPEEPAPRVGPMPFVRVYDIEEPLCMTRAETPLYSVPRKDAQVIGFFWEHQGLVLKYGAAVRTEDGAESDWYLVCAYDGDEKSLPDSQYDNLGQGWVPSEALTAWDAAAELPRNAAFSLDQNGEYYEDGEKKTVEGYLSPFWENCWFLTGTDAATGRPTLVNREGRSIQVADRDALKPYAFALPTAWTNAPDELPDPEAAPEQSWPEITAEEYRAMQRQDAEEASQVDGSRWDTLEWGGKLHIKGLVEPVGDRYRATIVHTVQRTASEEAMARAGETGWLDVDGSWYLYQPGSWEGGQENSPSVSDISWCSNGPVTAFDSLKAWPTSFEPCQVEQEYYFLTGIDRFTWRLEKTTGTYWLWLDPDTPVDFANYRDDNEGDVHTITPLKDYGELWGDSDTSIVFDEDGNLSISIYFDGK